MDQILDFCAVSVRNGRKIFEAGPEVLSGYPLAADPDPRATMTTFAMVDVCRGADVADAVLQVEQRLGFLDIFFLTSHRSGSLI
ncbi:MAG TPA: hypothetical protein VEM77_03755 [Thermoplasmata archaeon]|nr:hypothetical protein [Thermoplasmata archaeon]